MRLSENKYKERDPLKTVELIKSIFKKLSPDFEVRVESELGEGIGVYSCTVRLYYKGKLMLRTNGKGMSREYSLASGHAELYERFSNELTVNGYMYPFSDETPGLKTCIEDEFKYFPQTAVHPKDVENFLLYEAGSPRASVYKCLTGKEDALIDPRHFLILIGTNGMAAGNTLEEALNQGLSELCERYVMINAYFSKASFDELSMDLIKEVAPAVYEKTRKIEEKGFFVRYFDASRTMGVPVVMSIWVDKRRGIHAVRLGSFPDIAIALERCVTENLQGRSLENGWEFLNNIPFNAPTREGLHNLLTEFTELLPESNFEPVETLKTVNEAVYLKDASNEEMLSHYIKIFKNLGADIYYKDTSLSENIFSVQIHSPQMNEALSTDYLELPNIGLSEINEYYEKLKKGNFTRHEAMKIATGELYNSYFVEQFLVYKYKNTPVAVNPILYFRAIFSVYAEEYIDAEIYFNRALSEDLAANYDITLLRTYVSYKNKYPDLSDDELLSKMALWGYSPYEFSVILKNDKAFLKKYLNDVLFAESYIEKTAVEAEIRNILDNAKNKKIKI